MKMKLNLRRRFIRIGGLLFAMLVGGSIPTVKGMVILLLPLAAAVAYCEGPGD